MFRLALLFLLVISSGSLAQESFKEDQLRYPRVRQAYAEKEEDVLSLLEQKELNLNNLELYLRAFKKEKEIELWGRDDKDELFTLIKTFDICMTSGVIGPKRKQGDRQIPEGFYHIDRFNAHSNFYLSLGINYPNKSDRIMGDKSRPGGDIFIHGSCVTIGCMPITDKRIKELYVFCVEARNNGQTRIPVTIFPSKLSDHEFERLMSKYQSDTDKTDLWTDLKKGYDIFNTTGDLPAIEFLDSGRHNVR